MLLVTSLLNVQALKKRHLTFGSRFLYHHSCGGKEAEVALLSGTEEWGLWGPVIFLFDKDWLAV